MSDQTTRRPYPMLLIAVMAVSTAITVILLSTGRGADTGPAVVAFFGALTLYSNTNRILGVISFSLWVLTFISVALYYPSAFESWGTIELSDYIMWLIMSVMFCMGTTLRLGDFLRVGRMPRAVLIGVVLQFSVMPLVGRGVAAIFTNSPEVTAGIMLVGSSPGGVASNVMAYLAGGNVALSVTMTAVSTALSPIMTPFIMSAFAGTLLKVDVLAMMMSIVRMIIIPVGGGLIVHAILERLGRAHPAYLRMYESIMRFLPKYSMAAIVFVCAILTANARDQLMSGGFVIMIASAVVVHNIVGLTLGYWGATLAGLDERDRRTVAIEVGLQNSGMASVLALDVFKSALASIPGVIYSSWHNITGAILAGWWSHHPPEDGSNDQSSSKSE